MVFDKVKEILADKLDVDEDIITMDTNVIDDLGADSLDVVELMMCLEEELHIVITDESIHGLQTVGDIVNFIDTLV